MTKIDKLEEFFEFLASDRVARWVITVMALLLLWNVFIR